MFSFVNNPTSIYVKFNGSDTKLKKSIKISGQKKNEEMLLFLGQEAVSGVVEVVLPPGRTIDHLGIKIEMIGQIGEL
jgi:Vacuolar protein sorting-associated protein 26